MNGAGVEWWFGLVNYERRHPSFHELKLDRMRALLTRLGNPHQRLRIIHLTGTKGKGSTSAMLAEILSQAGYRTGLFTSPHLNSVRERFQVAGQPISPAEVEELIAEVRTVIDLSQMPTFFEVGTAVGFLHFLRRRCEFAVVEVGFGGRFDSTNVVTPLVSVITSISLDHTQVLGDTVEKIAFEKAGIIKPRRPCVSGVLAPGPRAVITRICEERQAPMRQLGRDFTYEYTRGKYCPAAVIWPEVQVTSKRPWPACRLGLWGEYQAANASLAVAAVELLREQGVPIADAAVMRGLAAVKWPARFEVVAARPYVVLDCAHNVASAAHLARLVSEAFPESEPRVLVFACSSDKDYAGMLRELAKPFARVHLTRFALNPRAVPPSRLAEHVAAERASVYEDAESALRAAQVVAGETGVVVVAGSVFLAGELRRLWVPCD